jgi:aminomuconate-semialdehyde/2-hydroxymuconate-6-semialdehyde dehydrogenase
MAPPPNMLSIRNYIDGRLADAASSAWLDNVEPATGKVYSTIPDSDERDVNAAVEAAKRAFPGWSSTPAHERSRLLLRLADLIDANADHLARAETIDNGKPLSLSRSLDIPRCGTNLRHFATAILHTRSDVHVTDGKAMNFTLRSPRGVAGCISPWNLPLYLFTWKIAPALATGNTVVAKPSEVTPMTAFMLSELAMEAGLPPGVLNIVHGMGAKAGAALVAHPEVPTISFTGGTATGEWIARTAGPMFKRLALELGGKNPNIVFADADYDDALATSVKAAFLNQGEICLCGSRLFVERSIADRFTRDVVERTKRLKVGDPLEDGVDVGAIVSRPHFDKIMAAIDLAKREGGTILCGGRAAPGLNERCRDGFFIEPTVVTGLDHRCRVNQEEIFGPVVSIMPFDAEDDVIAMANSVKYGLSSSVWTRDLDRAHRVASRLDAGTVWVNCWLLRDLRVPFGGMKASGVGREGGDEALRFFTEAKNVCVKL